MILFKAQKQAKVISGDGGQYGGYLWAEGYEEGSMREPVLYLLMGVEVHRCVIMQKPINLHHSILCTLLHITSLQFSKGKKCWPLSRVYYVQSTLRGISSFIPETEFSISVTTPWPLADGSMPG